MKIMEAYKVKDLRPAEWRVVSTLCETGGDFEGNLAEFAKKIGWDISYCFRVLNRLQGFGVIRIEKEEDAHRYVTAIRITEEWR